MTITNHTCRIAELAGWIIQDVDDRKYHAAHLKLDDIETLVRKAHRHIDNLQLTADCAARPAGGS